MEKTITYLKKPTFNKVFFALLLILAGLYVTVFNSILAGIVFLCIGVNLLSTEGSQINLENNTYRPIRSIFGFHFGSWKPCPEFDYISVFKTKESMQISVAAAPITAITTDIVFINLFFKSGKHITVYKTDDKGDAFKVADHFKMALHTDVLDATQHEKVWL